MFDAPIRLYGFYGGLHLDDRKSLATGQPIGDVPLPEALILPLSQHIGGVAKSRVKVGDVVRRGQTVADPQGVVSSPVHAPTSGRIVAIEPRRVPHPSGLTADCIVLEPDGLDQPLDAPEWTPLPDFTAASGEQIRNIARAAGIVGLGGAAFPSAIKLNPGRVVDTLIINGAECEPYISCDQMLMTEQAEEIVLGIRVVLHALGAPRCLIGVEDNKPEAIRALSRACENDAHIHVVVVPTRYPQGGEKQLIQTLTGLEVPSEGLPLDLGIVCHNPGTVRAVGRAVCFGEPLIERIITVTGEAVAQPRNFRVRLGTPMRHLVEQAGGLKGQPGRLLMGGPMMGFALPDLDVPVIKATNCVLALEPETVRATPEAQPCIRCGECVTVCPSRLLPQQLYWHARAREFEAAENLNLFDCIECGCCAIVCPSHIPLVQYYRFAKTEIHAAEAEKREADAARLRHEARQARIEREEKAKEEARARKKAALAAAKSGAPAPPDAAPAKPAAAPAAAPAGDDPVAIAMARAQARRSANNAVPAPASVETEPTATEPTPPTPADDDPVAKAIAAAQARKAGKGAETPTPAEATPGAAEDDEDPVAKAIAAAKARKAAKEAESPTAPAEAAQTPSDDDPVAKAMAAAKARKAAKAAAAEPPPDAPATEPDAEDPVAKAMAAAKARKAAKAAAASPQADDGDDPVAKAIAAAKARKAARHTADDHRE